MKFHLKLLKDWKDGEGTAFKAGDVIEIDSKEVASQLIIDDIAEKTTPAAVADSKQFDQKALDSAVKSALEGATKDLPENTAKHLHEIQTKDLAESDLSHGYLRPVVGREHTLAEKQFGLGQFGLDVYTASKTGMPERLSKSLERGDAMIKKAVADGYASKAAVSGGMVVGVDSDGGFLVPPEFSSMLLEIQDETAMIRPLCSSMTIGSDSINLPQFVNYDHSSNLIYGGALAYFKGENGTLTVSKPTMEEVSLHLNALTAYSAASHQMIKFAPQAIGSFLFPALAAAVTWKEEDKFLNGTGSGMPLGIVAAPGKVSVAIESGQTLTNGAIVSENIVKMYARLKSFNRASQRWLYNRPDLFNWLSMLKQTVGTGGTGFGLLSRIAGSPDMDLVGIPLMDNEHCQAAGTVGDIILADFSQYIIADHQSGPEAAQSMHIYFDAGQEAFRIMKYVDAQPRHSAAFTRQNSTNTTSPIVTLAARS